jgi:predicted outer membrane repeat protein
MHNPSCAAVSWSGGLFSSNTAADGGALFLTEITTRHINGSAVYEHNLVRGMQGATHDACARETEGAV